MKIFSTKKEFFFISLLFIFLCIIFFWKIIFLGKTMLAADVLREWYPWRAVYPTFQPAYNSILGESILHHYPLSVFKAEVFRYKNLPLWNPYIFCGTPFLAANETLVFNPLNILYLLVSVGKAFGYINMLEVFLAGLFMYLFLREILLCKSAALLGSIVFMFNGFFIVWMEHLDLVASGIWLPLVLFFFERVFNKKRKLFYSLLAGVGLAMSVFCGLIQIAFYVWLGAALYVIARIFQSDKNRLRYCTFSIIGFIIGLALSAVQIIPTVELITLSQRYSLPYRFGLLDVKALRHIITFIIPDFFGSPVNRNYWGLTNYVELCGYIGIFPLALLCLAFPKRKDKRLSAFWVIATVSLLVYLKTPVDALFYFIPGYAKSPEVSRIIFLYTFSAAALSGIGFDFLVNRNYEDFAIKKFIKIIFGCLAVISLFLFSFYIFLNVRKMALWSESQKITHPAIKGINFISPTFLEIIRQSRERFLSYYHPFSPAVWLPLVFILASALIFIFYLKYKNCLRFKLMAIALVIIDLFYFGMRFLAFSSPEMVYPVLESVEYLRQDKELYRVVSLHSVFIPNTMMAYNIYTPDGYMSLFPKRYFELMSGLRDSEPDKYSIRYVWPSNVDSPLLNLLNVKYIFTKGPLKNNRLELVYNKEMLIYRNKDVLPRAFIVPKAKVIKDKESIFRELCSPGFNPRKYIILEEEPRVELAGQTQLDSQAIIDKYSPGEVILSAHLSDNGLLFLSDTYYPGWKVYVDGRPDKIYCANYAFRAVYLRKGKHNIRFVYEPKSFKIGGYISFLSFALVILWVAGSAIRRIPL